MAEKVTAKSAALAALITAGATLGGFVGTYTVSSRGVVEHVPGVKPEERVDSKDEGRIVAKAGESPVKEGVFELWWYARKSQCRARSGTADFETGIAEEDCSGSLIVRDGEAYRRGLVGDPE